MSLHQKYLKRIISRNDIIYKLLFKLSLDYPQKLNIDKKIVQVA